MTFQERAVARAIRLAAEALGEPSESVAAKISNQLNALCMRLRKARLADSRDDNHNTEAYSSWRIVEKRRLASTINFMRPVAFREAELAAEAALSALEHEDDP